MVRGTCKHCGTKWSNKDEIVSSTRDEHRKAMGHELELD